jgi:hypothetical protein
LDPLVHQPSKHIHPRGRNDSKSNIYFQVDGKYHLLLQDSDICVG